MEIRLKSGYHGIEVVKDDDGWYLDAGTYGELSFSEKPTKDQIDDYAELLRDEFLV